MELRDFVFMVSSVMVLSTNAARADFVAELEANNVVIPTVVQKYHCEGIRGDIVLRNRGTDAWVGKNRMSGADTNYHVESHADFYRGSSNPRHYYYEMDDKFVTQGNTARFSTFNTKCLDESDQGRLDFALYTYFYGTPNLIQGSGLSMDYDTRPAQNASKFKLFIDAYGNNITSSGLIVKAGNNFSIGVKFRNPTATDAASGDELNATWYKQYCLDWDCSFRGPGFRLAPSNSTSYDVFGARDLTVTSDIAPGNSHTFNVTMVAPTTPGTYRLTFRLKDHDGSFFGEKTPRLTIIVQ